MSSLDDAASDETVRGLSLNAVSDLLRARLGPDAPSRITLHRHSKKGELARFVVQKAGARQLYDGQRVLAYYKDAVKPSGRASLTARAMDAVTNAAAGSPGVSAVELGQALAPLIDMIKEVRREVASLQQVRSSLMLKYDAVAALQQQKLDQLNAEIDRLKEASDVETMLTKLRIDVGRLTNLIEARQAAD